ncbi:MAG: Eukaryotic peptide chain release factor GTP-binding subunit [Chaenotheca gracillima]|nr:MAG: Eukaryotic peptide chain release factor GTP-binding subunit [Chaenotheca gracillima]
MDGLTKRDLEAKGEPGAESDPGLGSSAFVATVFAKAPIGQRFKDISYFREALGLTSNPKNLTHRLLSLDKEDENEEDGRSLSRQVLKVYFSIEAPSPSLTELRRHPKLRQSERDLDCQISIQRADSWRKERKLAVFDMDSTLIQQEVIDELARVIGVEKEVSAITERAMNGELDFTASLKARVALLKGVPGGDVWDRLKSDVITFTPGARDLCAILKHMGYKMAVLSGGFLPLAEWVKDQLELDYAYANQLVMDPETSLLTGETTGPIVDATRKAELLVEIAQKEGIPLRLTMAIGDGANDLLMMRKAGLGVAFNAKAKVKEEAPTKLTTTTLVDVLYILGYTEKEQIELLNLSKKARDFKANTQHETGLA